MALDHFAQLASLQGLPDFPVDIFFSATQRIIHAASDVLYSILETNLNFNRLEILHDIMRFVIETTFLLLPSSESFGYLLFNQLSGLLLSPVIHSFFPLSIKSLGYLLEPTNSNPSVHKGGRQKSPDPSLYIDHRLKLLEFFRGVVSGLSSASLSLTKTTSGDGFCKDASSMLDTLILETIRHLKGMLSPISVDNRNPDATSDARAKNANIQAGNKVDSCSASLEKYLRVRRLAVKDAMWHLCSVFHILIGLRTPDGLSSANSDNKSVKDLDYLQRAGSGILAKTISRELFELVISIRLRHHEKCRLPFGASGIPVGVLTGIDITKMAAKAARALLVTLEEARSHRERKNPMQESLESNHEVETRPLDHTARPDSTRFSNHDDGMVAVNGIMTDMYYVLDDAEHGMLLCMVERYVNSQ